MAYEPKTWVTGEVITADDLNQITPFIEPLTSDEQGYSITTHNAGVIFEALGNGRPVFLFRSDSENAVYYPVTSVMLGRSNDYILTAIDPDASSGAATYTAASADVPFVIQGN